MRRIFTGFLGTIARLTIRRFKPVVIAITGSVGKTGTKDAIALVVASHGTVRKSSGNLNNEIGVPLTILGKTASGGANPFFWMGVLLRAFWKLIRGGAYPKYLVLEMGADHPGDISYLTWIARPDMSVVTAVTPVHMEFYKDIADVAKEKASLVTALDAQGTAILNADDDIVRSFQTQTSARKILYGRAEEAAIRIMDAGPVYGPALPSGARKAVLGSTIHVKDASGEEDVFIQGVLGDGLALHIAAAMAVGQVLGMTRTACAVALRTLRVAPGRMRLLDGADDVLLIDDTYNASPDATRAALHALAALDPRLTRPVRRYALLGHMAELGLQADALHEAVGRAAAEAKIDGLIVLGAHAHAVARGAEQGGMTQERIFVARHHEEAVAHLRTLLEPGDIVLVKGSQAARMEAATAALLANPALAPDVLVRQTAAWQKTRPVIRLQITE